MCGRFSLDASIDVLIERYKAELRSGDFKAQDEVFPTNTVPIVINRGQNELRLMKWGFMPHFVKRPLINARAETVDIKPTFRKSFYNRRCIVPVTSFYEWQNIEGEKIRKRISIEGDGLFSLAGLYDTFIDKDGKEYKAFTIITTEANQAMLGIHHRMPVIITKDMEDYWLDSNSRDLSKLKSIMKPYENSMVII